MKLTKQQIDYAFERIDGIVKERVNKKAPPAPERPAALKLADKYALVAAGKAVLRPLKDLSQYTDFVDAYDFPEHSKAAKAYDKALEEHVRKVENIRKAEEKKAQKVKDKIMLSGDAEAALKLIEAYAAEA